MNKKVTELCKNGAQSVLPQVFRAWQLRYGDTGTHTRIQHALSKTYKGRVMSGPFHGMVYVEEAVCSTYFPKIIGSYEEELHPIINHIVSLPYKTIVDIGCAEGYYAIGLALKCPTAQVFAFDIDDNARNLCVQMSQLNSVGNRVTVAGECSTTTLNGLPLEKAVIICDCEGYEIEILNPILVPGLAQCDLLVELHDFVRPGLAPTLVERFSSTHEITLIDTVQRDPGAYPCLSTLKRRDQEAALTECRPGPMQWAFMSPLKKTK